MFGCWYKTIGRAAAIFATAMTFAGSAPQPASAQNLFEALFGSYQHRRAMPPRVSSYADPFGDERPQRRASYDHAGPSKGFCVRTCDGRFFPVRSSGNMTAVELCKSFCPGARTKVFSGSKIDHSIASDGTRYADLENAFVYRERKVDNCTCNGRDAFGLVPLKPEIDPTLKPGDIVATNEGLVTYSGHRNAKSAEFTPIDKVAGSSEWKLRLMSIKVAPAPEREEPAIAPVEDEKKPPRHRRAQR